MKRGNLQAEAFSGVWAVPPAQGFASPPWAAKGKRRNAPPGSPHGNPGVDSYGLDGSGAEGMAEIEVESAGARSASAGQDGGTGGAVMGEVREGPRPSTRWWQGGGRWSLNTLWQTYRTAWWGGHRFRTVTLEEVLTSGDLCWLRPPMGNAALGTARI